MNNVKCPHCGKQVEISEAFKHQIEAEALLEISERHKKELEEAKLMAVNASTKKIQEQFALQIKQAKEDTEEKDQRITGVFV